MKTTTAALALLLATSVVACASDPQPPCGAGRYCRPTQSERVEREVQNQAIGTLRQALNELRRAAWRTMRGR